MADLVQSLRNLSKQPYRIGGSTCDTIAEAVDQIERLRRIIALMTSPLPLNWDDPHDAFNKLELYLTSTSVIETEDER